jgi:energy-coupling factor transport system ATP-binding protein
MSADEGRPVGTLEGLDAERREGTQTGPVLTVEHVNYAYARGVVALRDVNLAFPAGDFAAVIGSNGSGKSTLMKLLVGLLKPTSGRVLVGGVDTRQARVSELARQVGFIFQNPNDQLFANTVADEIRFGLRNLRLAPAVVEERLAATLQRFDLASVRDVFPRFLSRGDKQKVCIASIVAMQPKVLLLDEPTTGQDHRDSSAIMGLAQKLNAEGITVLLVTHDLVNVAAYARRCVVLRDGAVVKDAPTAEVMADEELLAACHLVPPQIVRLSLRLADAGVPLALTVEALEEHTRGRIRRRQAAP